MDVTSYLLGKKAGGGGDTPTGTIDITQNGTYNVSSYASADVDVQPDLESKSVTISTNTVTTITPTEGKDGLSSVEVTTAVPQPSGKIQITQNGTDIDVSSYATADVNVGGGGKVELGLSYITFAQKTTATTQEIQSSIDNIVEKIDFSTVTSTRGMFQNCQGLTSLDLSKLDTSSVMEFIQMFYLCSNITEIDMSMATTPNNAVADSMFHGCTSLQKLDIRSFEFTKLSSSYRMFGNGSSYWPPTNCLIIVKDATQKSWMNTNFNFLTNVKTVSEIGE